MRHFSSAQEHADDYACALRIETCSHCGRAVKSIACIEYPVVVQKILDHLAAKASAVNTKRSESRAPRGYR
jgi:hypothetical protein